MNTVVQCHDEQIGKYMENKSKKKKKSKKERNGKNSNNASKCNLGKCDEMITHVFSVVASGIWLPPALACV